MWKWVFTILLVVVVFKLWQKVARFKQVINMYKQMFSGAQQQQAQHTSSANKEVAVLVPCHFCGLQHTVASSIQLRTPAVVEYYCSEQHLRYSQSRLN